jgi:hypothetical protein
MVAGTLLLVLGAMGGCVGTFLCAIGVAFAHQSQVLTLIWALASIALIAVAARLMRARSQPKYTASVWGPAGMFLLLLVLAVCGWFFVFTTCNFR